MATKKASISNSAHTAGIFADLSVDGPVIGTLVAIVDRAKNLPNRKTIGKQDPYCAARLGKEAKKTSTDIRGGQTPKWDQELRFTVHDSADYYQLKISVFTDDKKTDLIGESWVDLKNIVVPGGGQKDIWQNLTCRGKYAGEIRVEITYYDSRPKPEKAPVKVRHSAAADLEGMPPKQKTPMKRRPLPSDPVTGEAPPVNSAPATPDYHQTPPRHTKQPSHSAHISSQSPLQSVEYSVPSPSSHHRQQPDPYNQAQPTQPSYYPHDSYRQPDPYEAPARPYDQHASPQDPRGSHSSLPEVYDGGFRDPRQSLPPDDERPPPPPAHRSRHNSQNSFDTSPTKMPMRHDVLRNEAHRNSAPSYPGQPTYRGFDSAPPTANQTYQPPEHGSGALRHHSHDGTHEAHYRAMQPTVEDAPDSPTGQVAFRQSGSRRPHPDDMYAPQTSPAPLNLSRSPGASSNRVAVSPMQTPNAYDHPHGHSAPVSPLASRDFSTSPGHGGYNASNQYANQRHEPEPNHFQSSGSYALPALPASLVPGVDPALSQEITDRIYEERRGEMRYTAPMSTPPRGRQQSEPPASYGQPNGAATSHGYSPHGYERQSRVSYGGHEQHPQQHRQPRHSVSPVPPAEQNHTIRRKSVSPIPPSSDERRSFEVPFSPDSFDAFNPGVASSREGTPMGEMPENGGKIITHDGKEIDPSDHLPVESWAPEPEPKAPSQALDTRSRPMPGGAQPMPQSGRKQLRVARQQALPAPSPSAGYNFSSEQVHTPPAPAATGRNRLHKRPNRGSGVPSPAASSPLAPISPDNYQDRQTGSPYTPTRGLPRAQTWDYPIENHSPQQHQPHPNYGPPVPAKVPLALMSGANMGPGDERSLMEEMQSIDIGAGRSRRRGGGY